MSIEWQTSLYAAYKRIAEKAKRIAELESSLRTEQRVMGNMSDKLEEQAATIERLNADMLDWRRRERKLLGLPEEVTVKDHLVAIETLKAEAERLTDRLEAEQDVVTRGAQRVHVPGCGASFFPGDVPCDCDCDAQGGE